MRLKMTEECIQEQDEQVLRLLFDIYKSTPSYWIKAAAAAIAEFKSCWDENDTENANEEESTDNLLDNLPDLDVPIKNIKDIPDLQNEDLVTNFPSPRETTVFTNLGDIKGTTDSNSAVFMEALNHVNSPSIATKLRQVYSIQRPKPKGVPHAPIQTGRNNVVNETRLNRGISKNTANKIRQLYTTQRSNNNNHAAACNNAAAALCKVNSQNTAKKIRKICNIQTPKPEKVSLMPNNPHIVRSIITRIRAVIDRNTAIRFKMFLNYKNRANAQGTSKPTQCFAKGFCKFCKQTVAVASSPFQQVPNVTVTTDADAEVNGNTTNTFLVPNVAVASDANAELKANDVQTEKNSFTKTSNTFLQVPNVALAADADAKLECIDPKAIDKQNYLKKKTNSCWVSNVALAADAKAKVEDINFKAKDFQTHKNYATKPNNMVPNVALDTNAKAKVEGINFKARDFQMQKNYIVKTSNLVSNVTLATDAKAKVEGVNFKAKDFQRNFTTKTSNLVPNVALATEAKAKEGMNFKAKDFQTQKIFIAKSSNLVPNVALATDAKAKAEGINFKAKAFQTQKIVTAKIRNLVPNVAVATDAKAKLEKNNFKAMDMQTQKNYFKTTTNTFLVPNVALATDAKAKVEGINFKARDFQTQKIYTAKTKNLIPNATVATDVNAKVESFNFKAIDNQSQNKYYKRMNNSFVIPKFAYATDANAKVEGINFKAINRQTQNNYSTKPTNTFLVPNVAKASDTDAEVESINSKANEMPTQKKVFKNLTSAFLIQKFSFATDANAKVETINSKAKDMQKQINFSKKITNTILFQQVPNVTLTTGANAAVDSINSKATAHTQKKNITKTSNGIPVQETVEKPVVKHQTLAQRHLNPPPLFHVPTTCTVTSASPSQGDTAPIRPVLFSSFSEILGSESNLYSSDRPKPFGHDPFDLGRPSEALPELPEYMPTDLPSILDSSLTSLNSDFNMIERVPCLPPVKKEVKPADTSNREANYTITTNSGIPIIHKVKNRKRLSCIGSLSRMPKTPKTEPSTIYDNEIYNVNKKAKMMSTYGKAKANSLRYPYAGSLSDRLQLIDTTPTGEDPYQIGEAEMREQSPIPRLVLPKNNRVRVHTGEGFGTLTTPPTSTASNRRIYDPEPEPKTKRSKKASKVKTNRRKSAVPVTTTALTSNTVTAAPELEPTIKKEENLWEPFSKKNKPSSLNDFSYGETSANLAATTVIPSGELVTSGNHLPSATLVSSSNIDLYSSCKLEKMDITKMSYNDIFEPEASGDENVEVLEPPAEPENPVAVSTVAVVPRTKKRGARTTSLASSSTVGEDASIDSRRAVENKRGGRKRALSSASSIKREKAPPKPRASRGRGGYRGKRGSWNAVPPLTTRKPYHTALGHPDISWYLGHDPDVKKEDVDQLAENTSSNVEVPRWRTMIFTSLASAEGTESTDDEVYRKRHQKLEAEERRQLRWHMRRVREQRHVERLRMRQRDPWNVSTHSTPPTYTVWPSPLRDLQLIEITDTLPVLAFGEDIPNLPEVDFVLPWVKTSKAQKRSKRSKTLH